MKKTYRKLSEPKYTDIKVLYVEEEGYFREKFLRVLNRRFAYVYSAADGKEGFDLYQNYKPDIIITDFKMKKYSGLEMVEKIRKSNDKVQVIVITTNEDYDFFIQSIDIFNHYVFEPINLEYFWIAVQRAVYQVRLKKELRRQKLLTRSILDYHEQLIFVSEKGEIVEFNQAFAALTGMDRSEYSIKEEIIPEYFINVENYFYPKNKENWIAEFMANGRNIAKVCWKAPEINVSCLMKAIRIKELDQILFICSDITRADMQNKEMEIMAAFDPLTRCFNRKKFDEVLSEKMKEAERRNGSFSLVLLTVNHFEEIVNRFGRETGDRILVILSTILLQRIREIDILARWGDEEFILLLPETDFSGAKELAEDMRSLIENFLFSEAGFLTCSYGISEFKSGISQHTLLQRVKQGLIPI